MATNVKKGKSGRDGERKASKRSDDTPVGEEKIEDTPPDSQMSSNGENSPRIEETIQLITPTPEPVYEEPILTQLIVESFEGMKERGLYEGYGCAVFVGNHHYKGQFSEGMMHGQGCYTWADGVIYEGEFTMNAVTGKGKYIWPDGSLYEGEVMNGLRHGFGTFRSHSVSYTGDWKQGHKQGKGRMDYGTSPGVSFYEGDWVKNLKHGWGTRCYPSGNVYQGMWFNNIRHGEGTMRWLNKDQMYTGQWESGIQHGMGQHIWFLRRKAGSQYPLRNMYDGEFVKGLRDGYGTFYYANGARYEGGWKDNMKHDKGKFVFKNGRIYEGVFERDHIVEYPSFEMDGVSTPDITQIRTRTPLPSDNISIHSNDSMNTYSPSFQLDVDHLLVEFAEVDREEEAAQVIFVIMRHISNLRKIYSHYSGLGYEDSSSPDNTFIMNRMQFWRFLKDCRLHHLSSTLMDIDRALAQDEHRVEDLHNPYGKILFREFTNDLVTIAFHVYHGQLQSGQTPVLSRCLNLLIHENILKHACTVNGYIYYEARRAVNALVHMDQAFEIYKAFCITRKSAPNEGALKMRQFLFMMNDLKLVNSDLTAKALIDIFSTDDPKVTDIDGTLNLELEICFLEFFEALVGCAQMYVTELVVKDPSTPRPSTTLTQNHSLLSIASPSRAASQMGIEEEQEDGTVGAFSAIDGEGRDESNSPAPRSASQMTTKLLDGTKLATDNQMSQINTAGSEAGPSHQLTSRHTEVNSTKRSEATMVDGKKSSSFISGIQSAMTEGQQPQIIHSMASMEDNSADSADEYEGSAQDEPLDEETRQFNFWTHQVHIFFVRKFFPAAQRFIMLSSEARKCIEVENQKSINEPSMISSAPSPDKQNTVVHSSETPVGEIQE